MFNVPVGLVRLQWLRLLVWEWWHGNPCWRYWQVRLLSNITPIITWPLHARVPRRPAGVVWVGRCGGKLQVKFFLLKTNSDGEANKSITPRLYANDVGRYFTWERNGFPLKISPISKRSWHEFLPEMDSFVSHRSCLNKPAYTHIHEVVTQITLVY